MEAVVVCDGRSCRPAAAWLQQHLARCFDEPAGLKPAERQGEGDRFQAGETSLLGRHFAAAALVSTCTAQPT